MRRFRKLNARRQTARRPLPQSVIPARSSLRPGGGGLFKASKQTRDGKRGSGERWKRGGDGAVPSSSFISSSSSHPLIPAVVVPHRIVRRFRLLVATCSCFLVLIVVVGLPLSSSRPVVPSSSRSSSCSSFRRLVVPSLGSSLVRRLVPAPRSSTRGGGGVLPFDGERAWQADEAGVVAEP